MPGPPVGMMLAEGVSLDRLVTFIELAYGSLTLPGLVGLALCCCFGRRTAGWAFGLGLVSAVFGGGFFAAVCWERSTVWGFYLAGGAPLLAGVGACLLARHYLGKPETPV